MNTARLLSTVAAAVLLTAGAASAQGLKQDQSPAATQAPAAQQKAPAEKTAPPMHSNSGMKADEGKSAQNKNEMKHETTGQAPKASDMDKKSMDKKSMDKSESPAANKSQAGSKVDPNGNAEMKGKTESGTSQKSSETNKASPSGTGTQSSESGKTGVSGNATTGQGAASSSAKLSTEQRTRISTIIKQQKVERVEPSKLNVSISVGTRLPPSVHFYPLPTEVVTIYPEWRGYDYILVGDQIVVINPRTHEIVAIIEA